MRKILTTLAIIPLILAAAPAFAGDLKVTLTGVKAKGGEIVVALYARDPLYRDAKYTASVKVDAAGTATVTIADVAPGDYAVSAFHDADGDGKLGFANGKLSEGTAISNAEKLRGAPSFDVNKIAIPAAGAAVSIAMSYPEDRSGW